MPGPRNRPDIRVGDKFEDLEALEPSEGMLRHADMRIAVRCRCGNTFLARVYGLWGGKTKCCAECANEKRKGPRKLGTPIGTEVGYFTVESHDFPVRRKGRSYHRYALRDRRCGHLIERLTPSADLRAQLKGGLRVACGCPVPYVAHGYRIWRWAMPDGRRVAVQEHRIVMERKLGRQLEPGEQVHHINNDGLDNRPENLQLRAGNHGNGAVVICHDCGSQNVGYAPIGEAA